MNSIREVESVGEASPVHDSHLSRRSSSRSLNDSIRSVHLDDEPNEEGFNDEGIEFE